jgi:ATP dependent DNA ligase-like protein
MQRHTALSTLPQRIRRQLTQLVEAAPDGDGWLYEIKYDGYRMRAPLDRGSVKLLTRTGLDWTHKYPAIVKAVAALDVRQAYLDGELCGVRNLARLPAGSNDVILPKPRPQTPPERPAPGDAFQHPARHHQLFDQAPRHRAVWTAHPVIAASLADAPARRRQRQEVCQSVQQRLVRRPQRREQLFGIKRFPAEIGFDQILLKAEKGVMVKPVSGLLAAAPQIIAAQGFPTL